MSKVWKVFLAAVLLAAAGFGMAKAASDHLLISQVQIGVAGNSSDEFVEVFNPTATSVDLSVLPLKLHIRNSSGSDSNKPLTFINSLIPSGGYFLIGPASGYVGTSTLDATYAASGNMLVANGSVYISTSSTAGVGVLDKLGWGSQPAGGFEALPFTQTLSNGQGMLRQDNLDTDNNSSDLVAALSCPRNSIFSGPCSFFPPSATSTDNTTASSTPGNTQSASSTALTQSLDVKIYRFLPNPVGDDAGNEWVELKNNGSSDVVLDGWLLDDKSTGSGPGSNAYALSGVMAAGAVARFIIPSGSFSLNNTGGDEVNLYWENKTLADTAAYTVAAPDDGIFELRDGIWQPPAAIEQSSGGSGGSGSSGASSASIPYSYVPTTVRITEFLPDPEGGDEGSEWVELYNYGDASVKLNGWILDGGIGSSSPSSTAFTVGNVSVAAKHYVPIIIPKNKFELANSGQDGIRLFTPAKQLLQAVVYQDPVEGLSYAVTDAGVWKFTVSTPGSPNVFDVPVPEVYITEILPNPHEGDEEFIELYNASSGPMSLQGFRLNIGNREKTFDDATVPPDSYLALYEEDLPTKLSNSGQEVSLTDNWGRILSEAMYGKAPLGQTFAWAGENYVWTEQPTPGADNEFVLAASTVDGVVAKPAVSKPTSSVRVSAGAFEKSLQRQVVNLSEEVSSLKQQLASIATAQSAVAVPALSASQTGSQRSDIIPILSLIFSCLALLGFLGKYLASLSAK